MRIGIDLDDVVAECAVPYLRAFAERYRLELPDEDVGWQTLASIEEVSGEEKDRFRIALYDGKFFSELEPYEDSPAIIERIAAAGHEIYFITARAERRRVVTETWPYTSSRTAISIRVCRRAATTRRARRNTRCGSRRSSSSMRSVRTTC